MIFQALKSGWKQLSQSLKRVRETLFRPLWQLLGRDLDDETLEEIEQLLYEADFGVDLTQKILDALCACVRKTKAPTAQERLALIEKTILEECHLNVDLKELWTPEKKESRGFPKVIFIAGINGSGKTTSIAKLALYYQNQGLKVLLGAADTFRAAAADQLDHWAQRVGVDIVKGQSGADPSSVVFDTLTAAGARDVDIVLIDTAGRLHNKESLMQELQKMVKVCSKVIPGAPHHYLWVLDAVTGQNALSQAVAFGQVAPISGIILTKIDGAAKGGIALALQKQHQMPVAFIGTGEGAEDLQLFELQSFVQEMFKQ
jgi:fused signal recognition particle receptor